MRSMPAMSSPTTRAARSATAAYAGWMSSVRSIASPPVERFAVSRSNTISADAGTLSSSGPCDASIARNGSSTTTRVSATRARIRAAGRR